MTATPYADAAPTYQARGWSPVPLPTRRKSPPPTGWTGYAAPMASAADVHEWAANGHGRGNVGLRTPETVLGLDLDAYDGKPGLETMLAAVERLGQLPPTWRSTSRDPGNPSGIRFYRVPPGRRWADTLGGEGSGVEVIHYGHRYAVAAPSLHPDSGAAYGWYDAEGNPSDAPGVADLPDLPPAWVAELDAGDAADRGAKADLLPEDVRTWLAENTPGNQPCRYLERVLADAEAALSRDASRHDAACKLSGRIIRAADQGHIGAGVALDTLKSLWLAALRRGKARDADAGEWERMITGAVALAVAAPTSPLDKGCCRPAVDVLAPETPTPSAVVEPPDGVGRHEDDPPGPVPGASWQPVDLADTLAGLLAGTITRHAPSVGRRDDGAALFYPGKVNGVAGASGSGKTWTALHAAAQELAAGSTVIYVDLEDDAAGVVGRLLDIGADPAVIGERFRYVSPDESYGLAARTFLEALVVDLAPSLVVIDSTGESMALDGAKPNDDDDTARWFRRLPTALARRGPAVVVLDHVIKADDGGLWPIGSQRKRAAINGAQYMQTTLRPFAKDTAGAAKLVCAKDRHGNYRPGQKVADLAVTPAGDRLEVELRTPEAATTTAGETFRPTGYMERVSNALRLAGEPLTFNGITDRVTGKRQVIRTAVDVLIAEGHITTEPGPRSSTLHTLAKPFHETEDNREPVDRQVSPIPLVTGSGSLEGEPGTSHLTGSGNQWGTSGEPVTEPAPQRTCTDCRADLSDRPPGVRTCPPCADARIARARANLEEVTP